MFSLTKHSKTVLLFQQFWRLKPLLSWKALSIL